VLYKSQYYNQIETVALAATAVVLAIGGGALMGAGSINLSLAGLVAVAGLVALLRPVLSLFVLVIAGLVIVGLVRLYMPGFEKVQWGVAGLATILGGIGLMGYLFRPEPDRELSPNTGMLVLFLVLICATALVNLQSLSQFIYGFKGYAQVVGFFFAVTLLPIAGKQINSLVKLIVVIAVIQLPFVLHQWLVLVPQRVSLGSGVVAEDVIAGTMGASATGGGSNAILSILLITAISIIAAGYKRGQLRPWKCAVIVVICMIPMTLNANRIASLYLVVVFLIIFGPVMFRRVSRFLAGGVLAAALIAASIWVSLHLSSRSEEFVNWQDLVVSTFERNTDAEIGYGAYELNRLTSITFWWSEQLKHPNVKSFLFGNGPGAAREAADSSLGVATLAGTRYGGMGIGLTGISSLLWELGVVGLAVVFALHLNAIRSAHWVASNLRDNPFRQFVAEGLRASVVVFALSLFHRNSFLFHITYQTLVYLVFGIVSVWHWQLAKRLRAEAGESADGKLASA
jgi:hypothetical protein